MFSKKELTQYIVAAFIFGLVGGCWLAMNFYMEFELMSGEDVYYHDTMYDKEADAVLEKYKKKVEDSNKKSDPK